MPLRYTTEPKVAKVSALQCHSSSGMPRPPRIEGITTPKEFEAIVEAIAFVKTLSYPMTVDLLQSLAGMKSTENTEENKRRNTLIESIIELNQLHDDICTDNCRKVYCDEDGEYIVYPDGSIDRNIDKSILSMLKKIESMKENNRNNNNNNNNKMMDYSGTIDYTNHKNHHFIIPLLSSSFLTVIPNGIFFVKNPIRFYQIDPYRMRKNDYGIDAKYEKHISRLIQHLIGSGLDKNVIFDLRTFSESIGMLFGYVALKYLPRYKRNLNNSRSIAKHGKHLFNLYIGTSNKSGHISSKSPSVRFFSEQSVVDFHTDLFDKKKVFMANNRYYIVYEPTEVVDAIAEEVFDFVRTLNFREPAKKIKETSSIFSFNFNDMMRVPIRDRMNIMTHSIGVKDGRVWVDINRQDNHFNRVYSLINTIKSESRLGLYERDVGTAQQTIMFNLVGGTKELYPLHHELINNKKSFRAKVMEKLRCDYDTAKEHITAISNGRDVNWYYRDKNIKHALIPFFKEAQKLSIAFIAQVEENDRFAYDQAMSLAKDEENDDFAIAGKRKYGVIFHLYTHYERKIRDAMKSCYTLPVYDVHDAVYSRENVDIDVLENAVLEQTGFRVYIE